MSRAFGCGPRFARQQCEVRDIFVGVKFKFEPLGGRLAKMRLRIGAKANLDCTWQSKIEQIIGMQVRELKAKNGPRRVAMTAET